MKFAKLFAVTAMTAVAATAHAQQTVNCNSAGAGVGEQSLSSPSSTCTVSQGLTSVVPVVARMTITATSQTLTSPGATAFSNTQATSTGVTDVGPQIMVSSNTGYSLSSSSLANFAGGSGNKPASDLLIQVNAGTFNPIGTMPGGSAATNLDTYNLTYKTRYTWTVDTPGTYTLTVNYTLTAP
jgi:hypothetical protein